MRLLAAARGSERIAAVRMASLGAFKLARLSKAFTLLYGEY
jgi:hypothetical protein